MSIPNSSELDQMTCVLTRDSVEIGTVFIDPDSARNLEVVSNVLTMKSKPSLLGEFTAFVYTTKESVLRLIP